MLGPWQDPIESNSSWPIPAEHTAHVCFQQAVSCPTHSIQGLLCGEVWKICARVKGVAMSLSWQTKLNFSGLWKLIWWLLPKLVHRSIYNGNNMVNWAPVEPIWMPAFVWLQFGKSLANFNISGRNLRAAKHRFESIQKPTGRIVAGQKKRTWRHISTLWWCYHCNRCLNGLWLWVFWLRFSILSKCYWQWSTWPEREPTRYLGLFKTIETWNHQWH